MKNFIALSALFIVAIASPLKSFSPSFVLLPSATSASCVPLPENKHVVKLYKCPLSTVEPSGLKTVSRPAEHQQPGWRRFCLIIGFCRPYPNRPFHLPPLRHPHRPYSTFGINGTNTTSSTHDSSLSAPPSGSFSLPLYRVAHSRPTNVSTNATSIPSARNEPRLWLGKVYHHDNRFPLSGPKSASTNATSVVHNTTISTRRLLVRQS